MIFTHNPGRVEAFSDAVFGFAATLMVITIDTDASFSTLVETNQTNWITFAVTFFVLVALWKVHYNFFRRTSYMDNWIITFNSILLFVTLYYIFPLKSMLNSMMGLEEQTWESLSSLFAFYGGGFVLIFLSLSLMYYRAYKKTSSIGESLSLLFYTRHFAIYVAVGLLSIVLATMSVGINFGLPGFIYVIIGFLAWGHAVWFNKKYKDAIE